MKAPRIIYLSPADDQPTGGIKVIYRHAELMAQAGADACVLHPFDTRFRCSWFEHKTPLATHLQLDKTTDFVVIPEIWASIFGSQCRQIGVRYAIFAQNGYLTHPLTTSTDQAALTDIYANADFILAISDDTAKMVVVNYPDVRPQDIVRARYSVSGTFGCRDAPTLHRAISYMPRKMAQHAAKVAYALRQNLPSHWSLFPIDGVSEARCAELLRQSSLFLSFSEFEGLPLPPLEAALSGNFVIGYTGQGAREYWTKPNFEEVHQGDIMTFVKLVCRRVRDLEAGKACVGHLSPGIERLRREFSLDAEKANLSAIYSRIAGGAAGTALPEAGMSGLHDAVGRHRALTRGDRARQAVDHFS